MPVIMSNLVNAVLATERLQKFLLVPEIEKRDPNGHSTTTNDGKASDGVFGKSRGQSLLKV